MSDTPSEVKNIFSAFGQKFSEMYQTDDDIPREVVERIELALFREGLTVNQVATVFDVLLRLNLEIKEK